MKDTIQDIINRFTGLNCLIIGDVMLDHYLWGDVERISPEAPVPVVQVKNEEFRLGGAANVAKNIQALGATPLLCSVIGNDEAGNNFIRHLAKHDMTPGLIIRSKNRKTTVKSRVIARKQQMLRYDKEDRKIIDQDDYLQLKKRIEQEIRSSKVDVVIFQDYDKGVISSELIRFVTEICRQKNIPIAVDPKKDNFFNFSGCDLFKPNLREIRESIPADIDPDDPVSLHNAKEALIKKLNNRITLITLSDKGVYVADQHTEHKIIPAHVRDVADVSGAGDTVISVAALCLALNTDVILMAELANLAGSQVCEHAGVVPVEKEQLLKEAGLLQPL